MDALAEIKELIKNGRQKSFTDKENSLIYFNKAKSIAKKENLEREIPLIDSFIQIHIEKDFDKADKLLDKYKESKNIQLLAYFYLLKGRIFSEKGDYDLVIEYCQKAFDTPGFDIPGNALNNIGLAYSDKGDYDRAIEYFQKASTEFEDLGENEYVRKISYLIINLTIENKIGRERFEASSISDLSDKIFKEDFIKKTALKDPGEKIKQILNEFNITAYQKYAEEYESRENDTNKQIDDDFLIILKGWSSSIPLVSGRINEYFEGNICKGGGYFIRWKEAGLVIDPGINFLENFHENKFHIADIDIVLITHNHLDHNYELLQINDAF